MTETSYTAWDDKLYQWPPPDGWYEAGDGKWWPEGYGPGAADSAGDSAVGAGDSAVGGELASTADSGSAAFGSADEAVSGGLGSAFADTAGSLTDHASGALQDPVSEVATDSVRDGIDSVADSLADALPGVVTDALPEGVADAAANHGSFATDVSSDAGAAAEDVAGAVTGQFADVGPGTDLPSTDDVGAALAETMSARSDDLIDPASSGIPGAAGGAEEATSGLTNAAEDAAADATQFMSTDLPRPDVDSFGGSGKTDLDALPPPPYTPPGFDEGPPGTAAADDLADLADPAPGVAPAMDTPSPARSLFPASGADTEFRPPSVDGPEPAVDETMPPPPTGASGALGGAAESFGLPPADAGTDPAPGPGVGRPEETMISPLGSSLEQSGTLPDPAETGQFDASPPDAAAWSNPAAGQYGAPPPPAQAGVAPGSMPWGQSGAPGGPPMSGGLDQPAMRAGAGSGSSRIFLLVGLGVAALLVLGVAGFLVFGGDDSGDDTAVAQTGPGSFVEPHTRTTPVEVFYPDGDAEQRFVIEVLEPVRDASGQADGDQPGDGELFAVTRVRVTNQTSADAPVSDLRFNAVTAAGDVINREDNACTTTEPPLDFAGTLGEAGVAEGAVCWVVPSADFAGLLLGIESTQVGGRIHISLQ